MQQIIWDCHDIYHRVAFALPKHSESQGFGDRSTGARPEAHTLRRRNGAGVPDGRAVDRRRGGVRCDERGGGGDAPPRPHTGTPYARAQRVGPPSEQSKWETDRKEFILDLGHGRHGHTGTHQRGTAETPPASQRGRNSWWRAAAMGPLRRETVGFLDGGHATSHLKICNTKRGVCKLL